MMEAASAHAIQTLYLQTEHWGGGLYAKLGWKLVQAHHECGVAQIVMVKSLALHGSEPSGITRR